MNIYSVFPFSVGFLLICLGIFVYLKNKDRALNQIFLLITLAGSIWLFSYAVAYSYKDEAKALFLFKLGYSGVIFIPITIFHYALEFLKIKKTKLIFVINYLLGCICIILIWKSSYLIKGVHSFFWGYYPQAGILHPLFLICFISLIGFSFALWLYFLWFKRQRFTALEIMQIKYMLVAFFIYNLASIDFLPNYGIQIYPFGYLPSLVFLTIVAYTIVRHQLMDIEVVIKKSLVFAGMFAFAFGVFVVVTLLVSQFVGGNRIISLTLSALIIIIGLRPIETWLVNSTDKFLFQKKYEYKQIIRAFIDKVATELNLDEVVSSTLQILDQALHPYASGIFILNKVEDKYQLYNSSGLEDKNISFNSDSRLVTFLKKARNPAVIRQINGISGVNPEIASEIGSLKAVLVLPLLLHNDLIGFISLGKKKSDEDYTKDDLDVLLDLARTESITVGNAQLLAEAAQAERRAAIGTMAAGINHEIGNPLNTITTKIQVFLAGVERGFYKDKSKEEIIQECRNILSETLSQTNRIADITRRLSNFAKPSKEFKPQLISIAEEIDETLAVLGHDLELERIKINRQISSDATKILADKREMQQILFNLIRNAAQAIEGQGEITIKAVPTRDNKVHIEIQDTGKGIAEDKRHRIFEPFFTTKGSNKGTGLGLSIVRQLVWRNKGEITFRSQPGVGTTFILEFAQGVQSSVEKA